jgi:hypothetical protein
VIATAIAIALFPGGTYLERFVRGYTFFGNFLSDLGMLVAWGGGANHAGAIVFISAELLLILALVLFFIALVRIYSPGAPRRLAVAAAIIGLVCCAAFKGAALLPADRFFAAHITAAIVAFRASMIAFVLFTTATIKDRRFSRTAAVAWTVLTLVMIAYVGVIEWGPRPGTTFGLTFQVTAQKIVVVVLLAVLARQSREAERIVQIESARESEPQLS